MTTQFVILNLALSFQHILQMQTFSSQHLESPKCSWSYWKPFYNTDNRHETNHKASINIVEFRDPLYNNLVKSRLPIILMKIAFSIALTLNIGHTFKQLWIFTTYSLPYQQGKLSCLYIVQMKSQDTLTSFSTRQVKLSNQCQDGSQLMFKW